MLTQLEDAETKLKAQLERVQTAIGTIREL